MESYSLLELNRYIRRQLKEAVPESYWVVAEINEIHVNGAGNCFLELIEKAPQSEQITAKAKANIRAYHFRMLRPYFETMTGQVLTAGIKVMVQVSVEFHELYGMSLQVIDINPAFTAGDLAVHKLAVLQKLDEEGVIDMNRELELTLVPQRIAVISSETAAGYGDFVDQLHHNTYGYVFRHTLFQAVMQGNEAETSIIRALEAVFEREDDFDAVVMIRGGGSRSDLNCFNSYRLACCMAQFPMPIITGIGHDRDATIADRVACIALKTPTAVAEFLVDRVGEFAEWLQYLSKRLVDAVAESIRLPAERLKTLSVRLHSDMCLLMHVSDKEMQAYRFRLSHAVSTALSRKKTEQHRLSVALQMSINKVVLVQNTKIPELQKRLNRASGIALASKQKQILWLENKLQLLDPDRLLQRGYTITLADGKVIRGIGDLKKGQRIETVLYDGKAGSVVDEIVEN